MSKVFDIEALRFDIELELKALDVIDDPGERATRAQTILNTLDDLASKARRVRNEHVAQLAQTAMSYSQVAELTGLTKPHVQSIVREVRALT